MNTNPMIKLHHSEICGIQGGAKPDDPPRFTDEEVLAIAAAALANPVAGAAVTVIAYFW